MLDAIEARERACANTIACPEAEHVHDPPAAPVVAVAVVREDAVPVDVPTRAHAAPEPAPPLPPAVAGAPEPAPSGLPAITPVVAATVVWVDAVPVDMPLCAHVGPAPPLAYRAAEDGTMCV